MNASMKETVNQICTWMDDKKAQDIVAIDVADRTIIADCFVIGSGRSDQQVRSIADEVEDKMAEKGDLPLLRKEGNREGRWIVLDYGDILIHVFHQDERKYYNMERLWADENNVIAFSAESQNLRV